MPTILLEISAAAGQLFIPTTDTPANAFVYTQRGPNHFVADASVFAGLPPPASFVGRLPLRDMLAECDALSRAQNALDRTAAGLHDGNRNRLTDIVLERAIALHDGAEAPDGMLFTITPPLPGIPTGAATDQETPGPPFATAGGAFVSRFGGTQFITIEPSPPDTGPCVLPTDVRLGALLSSESLNHLMLWLIPIYGCGCWSKFGKFNKTQEPPPPP